MEEERQGEEQGAVPEISAWEEFCKNFKQKIRKNTSINGSPSPSQDLTEISLPEDIKEDREKANTLLYDAIVDKVIVFIPFNEEALLKIGASIEQIGNDLWFDNKFKFELPPQTKIKHLRKQIKEKMMGRMQLLLDNCNEIETFKNDILFISQDPDFFSKKLHEQKIYIDKAILNNIAKEAYDEFIKKLKYDRQDSYNYNLKVFQLKTENYQERVIKNHEHLPVSGRKNQVKDILAYIHLDYKQMLPKILKTRTETAQGMNVDLDSRNKRVVFDSELWTIEDDFINAIVSEEHKPICEFLHGVDDYLENYSIGRAASRTSQFEEIRKKTIEYLGKDVTPQNKREYAEYLADMCVRMTVNSGLKNNEIDSKGYQLVRNLIGKIVKDTPHEDAFDFLHDLDVYNVKISSLFRPTASTRNDQFRVMNLCIIKRINNYPNNYAEYQAQFIRVLESIQKEFTDKNKDNTSELWKIGNAYLKKEQNRNWKEFDTIIKESKSLQGTQFESLNSENIKVFFNSDTINTHGLTIIKYIQDAKVRLDFEGILKDLQEHNIEKSVQQFVNNINELSVELIERFVEVFHTEMSNLISNNSQDKINFTPIFEKLKNVLEAKSAQLNSEETLEKINVSRVKLNSLYKHLTKQEMIQSVRKVLSLPEASGLIPAIYPEGSLFNKDQLKLIYQEVLQEVDNPLNHKVSEIIKNNLLKGRYDNIKVHLADKYVFELDGYQYGNEESIKAAIIEFVRPSEDAKKLDPKHYLEIVQNFPKLRNYLAIAYDSENIQKCKTETSKLESDAAELKYNKKITLDKLYPLGDIDSRLKKLNVNHDFLPEEDIINLEKAAKEYNYYFTRAEVYVALNSEEIQSENIIKKLQEFFKLDVKEEDFTAIMKFFCEKTAYVTAEIEKEIKIRLPVIKMFAEKNIPGSRELITYYNLYKLLSDENIQDKPTNILQILGFENENDFNKVLKSFDPQQKEILSHALKIHHEKLTKESGETSIPSAYWNFIILLDEALLPSENRFLNNNDLNDIISKVFDLNDLDTPEFNANEKNIIGIENIFKLIGIAENKDQIDKYKKLFEKFCHECVKKISDPKLSSESKAQLIQYAQNIANIAEYTLLAKPLNGQFINYLKLLNVLLSDDQHWNNSPELPHINLDIKVLLSSLPKDLNETQKLYWEKLNHALEIRCQKLLYGTDGNPVSISPSALQFLLSLSRDLENTKLVKMASEVMDTCAALLDKSAQVQPEIIDEKHFTLPENALKVLISTNDIKNNQKCLQFLDKLSALYPVLLANPNVEGKDIRLKLVNLYMGVVQKTLPLQYGLKFNNNTSEAFKINKKYSEMVALLYDNKKWREKDMNPYEILGLFSKEDVREIYSKLNVSQKEYLEIAFRNRFQKMSALYDEGRKPQKQANSLLSYKLQEKTPFPIFPLELQNIDAWSFLGVCSEIFLPENNKPNSPIYKGFNILRKITQIREGERKSKITELEPKFITALAAVIGNGNSWEIEECVGRLYMLCCRYAKLRINNGSANEQLYVERLINNMFKQLPPQLLDTEELNHFREKMNSSKTNRLDWHSFTEKGSTFDLAEEYFQLLEANSIAISALLKVLYTDKEKRREVKKQIYLQRYHDPMGNKDFEPSLDPEVKDIIDSLRNPWRKIRFQHNLSVEVIDELKVEVNKSLKEALNHLNDNTVLKLNEDFYQHGFNEAKDIWMSNVHNRLFSHAKEKLIPQFESLVLSKIDFVDPKLEEMIDKRWNELKSLSNSDPSLELAFYQAAAEAVSNPSNLLGKYILEKFFHDDITEFMNNYLNIIFSLKLINKPTKEVFLQGSNIERIKEILVRVMLLSPSNKDIPLLVNAHLDQLKEHCEDEKNKNLKNYGNLLSEVLNTLKSEVETKRQLAGLRNSINTLKKDKNIENAALQSDVIKYINWLKTPDVNPEDRLEMASKLEDFNKWLNFESENDRLSSAGKAFQQKIHDQFYPNLEEFIKRSKQEIKNTQTDKTTDVSDLSKSSPNNSENKKRRRVRKVTITSTDTDESLLLTDTDVSKSEEGSGSEVDSSKDNLLSANSEPIIKRSIK